MQERARVSRLRLNRLLGRQTAGVLVVLALMMSLVVGQPDVAGSKDHPLLSRFPGSVIIRFDQTDFDELLVPLGPATDIDQFETSQRVQGQLTRLTYEMDTDHSTLEVVQSYRQALSQAGFEILYSCSLEECGNHLFFQKMERPFIIDHDHRYLAARSNLAPGSVWVAVRVYRTARHDPPVRAMVNIAEIAGLKEGLITVDAETMAQNLEQTGHVALYGVHFDTDRTQIRPESEPTLQEMVKLLKQNPGLRVFIVGHTDSVGTVDYNLDLSQRRADAVVAELVSRGIQPERLAAQGVGSFAPLATNRIEEGRAQNRRVELVEQ